MTRRTREITAGYTLIETLTALFIITLVIGSVAAGSAVILRRTGAYKERIEQQIQLYGLIRSVNVVFEDIRIPYWERPKLSVSPGGRKASVSYSMNEETQTSIGFISEEKNVRIVKTEAGVETDIYASTVFSGCSFDIVSGASSELPIGIQVSLNVAGTQRMLLFYFPDRTLSTAGGE